MDEHGSRKLPFSPGWLIVGAALVAVIASWRMSLPAELPWYAIGSAGMLKAERAVILFIGLVVAIGLGLDGFGYSWPISLSLKWRDLELVAQGSRRTAQDSVQIATKLEAVLTTIETMQTGLSAVRAELSTVPQIRKDVADVAAQASQANQNLVALARLIPEPPHEGEE